MAMLLCPVLRLALLQHGVNYFTIHTNTLCRADSLLAGGTLALLLRTHLHDKVFCAGGWLFAGALLASATADTMNSHQLISAPSTSFVLILASAYSVTAIGSVGLVAFALGSRHIGRLFSLRPMRWLGRYSYGIYVLHIILFKYFEYPIHDALRKYLTPNKGVAVVLTGLLVIVLTLGAAYLSYNLCEKRLLRLKHFFEYHHLPTPQTRRPPLSS